MHIYFSYVTQKRSAIKQLLGVEPKRPNLKEIVKEAEDFFEIKFYKTPHSEYSFVPTKKDKCQHIIASFSERHLSFHVIGDTHEDIESGVNRIKGFMSKAFKGATLCLFYKSEDNVWEPELLQVQGVRVIAA